MAPRKNRPVLYEVMRRKHAGREPLWKRSPPAAAGTQDSAGPLLNAAAPGAGEAGETASGGAASFAQPLGALRAIARQATSATRLSGAWLSRGRVHLVLGWPELTFVALVLLAALYVSYQTGRAAGPATPAEPSGFEKLLVAPETAKQPSRELPIPGQGTAQPPTTPVSPIFSGSAALPGASTPAMPGSGRTAGPSTSTDPSAAAARPAVTSSRADQTASAPGGLTAEKPAREAPPPLARFSFDADSRYVIIQHFRQSDQAAAEKARDFLSSRGIDCVLVGGADIRLIATEPFRLTKDAAGRVRDKELRDLKKRIADLGKEYWYIGGYSFDKCYDRELK